jgi:hypothetical protein
LSYKSETRLYCDTVGCTNSLVVNAAWSRTLIERSARLHHKWHIIQKKGERPAEHYCAECWNRKKNNLAPEQRHYLHVRWNDWDGNDQPRRQRNALVRAYMDLQGKIYWNDSPSYHIFTEKDEAVIVKDYGVANEDTSYGDAYEQYILDNPPEPELKWGDGWLSPNGDFYSCPYCGHSWLADDLCIVLGYEGRSEDQLESHGWVSVRTNFIQSDLPPQPAQLQAIQAWLELADERDRERAEQEVFNWKRLWEIKVSRQ